VGKILPAKSWIVMGSSGQLISFLNNRSKGIIDNYSVKEFTRGDDIKLTLIPELKIGKRINDKDTIGYIYSNEMERQIAVLLNEINISKSLFEVSKSSEKESIIKEAEENLNYQTRIAAEQKNILNRQKSLYEKNLLSQEEYELSLNQSRLNDISVSIAKARLETVTTGVKKEELNYLNNQITSLQNQVKILQKRLSSYSLVSPIDGTITTIASGDTLFTISDNIEFVVMIPIKINDVEFIGTNTKVKISLPNSRGQINGVVDYIDNTVVSLSGSQVMFAVASVKSDEYWINGLMTECEIEGGSATVYEHLKRFMNRNIF
jgi:hypothetical protein